MTNQSKIAITSTFQGVAHVDVRRQHTNIGSMLSDDGSMGPEIRSKLARARHVTAPLCGPVFRAEHLASDLKLHLIRTLLFTVVGINAHTWSPLTPILHTSLQAYMVGIVRTALNEHDYSDPERRKSDEEVLLAAEMPTADVFCRIARLRFLPRLLLHGHLALHSYRHSRPAQILDDNARSGSRLVAAP